MPPGYRVWGVGREQRAKMGVRREGGVMEENALGGEGEARQAV